MNLIALLLILYLKYYLILCQSQCRNFQTCSGCIGYAHEKCVWCSSKNHVGRRCIARNDWDSSWCDKTYDPKENVEITSAEFSDGQNGSKVIQLTPQDMIIKARTNVPIKFNMSYKPAKHYPLDIYYLLDASESMKEYKRELYNEAVRIYGELSRITNTVKLGVGSFVEKPSIPYVDILSQTSYAFKHHQSLTDNVTLFTKALKDLQKVAGSNNDKPQADFDALLQAMVCTDEIGWTNNSHRIIFLSTDSTYHSAGDGKFVGAIKPPDIKCNLINNEYEMALNFDYPSVSKINKVAIDTNTMIIFAANPDVKNDYQALEKKIKNVRYVKMLKNSVVDMILEEYKSLVSSVQMEAFYEPFMSLTLEPDCTIKDKCFYKNNEQINISATLTFNSCPTDGKYNYDVKIGPVSIKEKLTLHLEVICQCECEKPGQGEKNSNQCSKAGTYQCGICECNENRYGEICNCMGTSNEDLEKCKTNVDDLKPCSGRGNCRCGKCINCEEGFSGDFCEFDDNSCERPGGVLCSGRGKCTFGKCQCDPHWLPNDCRCPDSDDACIAPHSKEPCSGRGDCVCGKCVCSNATSPSDSCVGTYCDECAESASARCAELQDYAFCNFNANKTVCDEKFNFTDTDVILVNKTSIYSNTWYMAKMWCRNVLEDGKTLVFRYHYPKSSSSTMRLIIQDELDMPAIADIWVTVGSVIGAMLLIGIITIVTWKVLVDLHDKREYEKFEKDSMAAGYDVRNPLYQDPATSFPNPAYRGGHYNY